MTDCIEESTVWIVAAIVGGIAVGALMVFLWMNTQHHNDTTIISIRRDQMGYITEIERHEIT